MSDLLKQLYRYKENRGMMANLRCILVESKKHRAWPVLHRLGVAIDNDVAAWVAGLFATYPETAQKGNFGTTCKAIEQKRGERRGDDTRLTTTERRFQHLLSAGRNEILGRVMRIVLMAKAQGVPINYGQLEIDLRFWTNRTKIEWATAFWAQGADLVDQEAE